MDSRVPSVRPGSLDRRESAHHSAPAAGHPERPRDLARSHSTLTVDASELPSRRTFVSHGVAIGVRTNDPTLLDKVPDCLPPGWEESPFSTVDAWYSLVSSTPGSGRGVLYRLYQDEEKLDEGFRLKRLLDSMNSAIRLHVGRNAPEGLFVHAGAVAWGDRTIVIPGRSGSGKTTLVAALVEAGATYFSDEYAVLDARGLVYPYARPLSVRQGAHRRVQRCAVADLGGKQATQPLPLGLVVHTRYRPDALWAPRLVSSGAGALALYDNTLVARERPAFAFSVLASAVSRARSLEGDRGAADVAASAILEYARDIHPSIEGAIP